MARLSKRQKAELKSAEFYTEEMHINVEYISLLTIALFLESSVDLWYNVISRITEGSRKGAFCFDL